MFKYILAVCVLAVVVCAQNPSNSNIVVVGNEAQPVQFSHRQNIQAAITKASQQGGFVLIPPDWPTIETYTNPGNVVILDFRGGTLDIRPALTVNGIAPGAGSGCVVNPFDNGCGLAGNPSIDLFIPAVAGGTGWLFQLIATALNLKVPLNVQVPNIAGIVTLGFNTDPGLGSGIGIVAPASGTPYNLYLPGGASSGYFLCSNVANKVSCAFEPNINLPTDVGTSLLDIPNGGTNSATKSGALLNLFPTPIRRGDIIRYDGAAWSNFGGNTGGGGSTGFYTQNGTGNDGWVQVPIPVVDGGFGLQTLTPGALYKGNGTAAPQVSNWSDDGVSGNTTEPLTFSGVGSFKVAYATASGSTNASIGATTMTTAGGSGNTYRITTYIDQTVLGTGCSSNTSVTTQILFTDPEGSSQVSITLPFQNFQMVNNGFLGSNSGLSGAYMIRAKASTIVQYQTTLVAGACTTLPFYRLYPILEQLN